MLYDARVIETIGDEVMIVGSDPAALTDWAVGFQALHAERPQPRIGLHCAARTSYATATTTAARSTWPHGSPRAAGGEVLVTRPVVDNAGAHLEFEPIGEVRLKGFYRPTELLLARPAEE